MTKTDEIEARCVYCERKMNLSALKVHICREMPPRMAAGKVKEAIDIGGNAKVEKMQ